MRLHHYKSLISLPTRVRLRDKGVQCPTQCVTCTSDIEDLAHLIFECPFATRVWNMTGFWHTIHDALGTTASTIKDIFLLVEILTIEQRQIFAATLWSLWKHRNLKVWEMSQMNRKTIQYGFSFEAFCF